MKTFSTSGTGSQQTLSEIESDKIPIYDSMEDVTADLANLEVGQIVATKDTGSELSAPVDVVQSGNMHAVTSNAVAESLSYSTTEQKTGGMWIDGKPIYRKTYYSVTNWANETSIGTISDLAQVTNIQDITSINGTAVYQNFGSDGTNISMARVSKDSNNVGTVVVQRLGGFVNNYPSTVIVEYTKTTD